MNQQVEIRHVFVFFLFILVHLIGCAQDRKPASTPKPMEQPTDWKNRSEAEWKKQLSAEQYYVLREKGTERPYTGAFYLHKEKGTYRCAGCGADLFTDDMKFDAHCGWPSFDREIAGGKVLKTEDRSHGMIRTEITCARCGGHLGHLFDDGPTQTGLRYCVNSVSLSFEPAGNDVASSAVDTITLGGGCFWCVEAVFKELKGVQSVVSGYAGGKSRQVSYEEVCRGNTGHAEVVQISFDPKVCSINQILEVFFTVHDPTTLNRQGADVGTQYRSVIFYHHEAQRQEAKQVIAALEREKIFSSPIVTEVSPFTFMVPAEDYHQNYYAGHSNEGYCRMVIAPKLEKFRKVFSNWRKSAE